MVNVEGSLSADLIAQQNFGAARRGFDPDEVRAFLVKVAAEIMSLHERQSTLEVARRDAEYRAAHPSFDEETLLGAVGDETAQILKSAHDAAGDIKTRAEENASRILKEAHKQAEALRVEAETVLARRTEEAEGIAGRIREASRAEGERLVDQARQQSKAIRAQAEAERNAMIEGAQATRDRILSALSRKRNVAVAQVEQLRAGRERLLEAYHLVRRTLDEVTDELTRAETEARAAADAVRHRPLALDEPDGLQDDTEPTNPTLPIVQKRLRAAVAPAPAPLPRPEGGSPPPPKPAAAPGPRSQWPAPAEPPPARPAPSQPAPEAVSEAVSEPVSEPVSEAVSEPVSEAPRLEPARPSVSVESGPDPAEAVPPAEAKDDAPPAAPVASPDSGPAPGATTETVAPPETAAATVVSSEIPPVSATGATVESLFARIRADRDRAVVHAHEVLAEDRPVPDADEVLLQRRDQLLEAIEANLTRRLKRALQDDQNDLLDRLRGLRASQKAAAVVLPSPDAHAARFRDAGQPFLAEAAAAGSTFISHLLLGARSPEHFAALDRAADDLAQAIVEPLRKRLDGVLLAGEGDDPVVLAEAVGGAYREWKTKRVEVVAVDHVAAVFAASAYAATPSGTPLRWLVEDADGPCPDCDDNVLAGDQPKGEPFPTGQRHPPAHPGCRCLLLPRVV